MNVAQHILVLAIRVYRVAISPAKTFVVGPAGQCRFTPSCSAYAMEAVSGHGAMAGSWLALKRICRCHPWGGFGDDPVPLELTNHCASALTGTKSLKGSVKHRTRGNCRSDLATFVATDVARAPDLSQPSH